MWIFKNTHKHISQDTLSEYLDGRLQGRPLEKVEQQLEQCHACRQELIDLQSVVAMMQQLPIVEPRRSFVMSAPPLDIPYSDIPSSARSRPSILLRAPSWVYAGAASFAALALVVTISLDASGGLDSNSFSNNSMPMASAPAFESEQLSTADGAATGTGGGLEMESTARSEDTATTGEPEMPQTAMSAAAPVAPPSDASAESEPAEAGVAAFGAENTSQDGPVTMAAAGEAVPDPVSAVADGDASATQNQVATKSQAVDEADGGTSATQPEVQPEVPVEALTEALAEVPEQTNGPITEQAESTPFGDGAESGSDTPVWLRVLEVAVGAMAAVFLVGLLLRWRTTRRDLV
jgi:hypothetical protein